MEPDVLEPRRPDASLQELAVGIHLDRQQVGDFHGFGQLAEVFADALFLSETVRH